MKPLPTPEKGARPVRGVGIVLVLTGIGAIALAGVGIVSRRSHQASLQKWTDQAALPTVATIAPQPVRRLEHVVLPGQLDAWYEAPIYARVNGYLQSWQTDIGAHVHRNEVLGVIDTPDLDQQLAQAKANLAMAKANAALANLTAVRWQALLKSNAVSEQDTDVKEGDAAAKQAAVQAAAANVDRLEALEGFRQVVAPFDGVVTARNTDIGALIDAGGDHGMPLFKVADIHRLRLYVQVPQAYQGALTQGSDTTFTVPQFPGQVFHGRLTTTSNAVSQSARTVLAEIDVPNQDGVLWPGAYAQVTFDIPPAPGTMQIPASAVIFQDRGTEVALLGTDGRAHLVPVKLGRDSGGRDIEVLSGLAASDEVIDSPPDDLSNGDRVTAETSAVHEAGLGAR